MKNQGIVALKGWVIFFSITLLTSAVTAQDTKAPWASITNQSLPSTTNKNYITFTFTSNETGSTFKYSLDGAAKVTGLSPLTVSGLKDGSHTFSVWAIDKAGNMSTAPAMWKWTVDTKAPLCSMTSGPETTTTSNKATFQFSANEANATFKYSVDGGSYYSCTSPFAVPMSFAPGKHTFALKATDVAGNESYPLTWPWTVTTTTSGGSSSTTDTTAPWASITNQDLVGLTNLTYINFQFTSNEANSTFLYSMDGSAQVTGKSPLTFSGLLDGVHTFKVWAKDAAGNVSSVPAMWKWTVDTKAPWASITNQDLTRQTTSTAVSFTIASNEAGYFRYAFDNNEPKDTTETTLTFSDLAVGYHAFFVVAVDKAGNVSPSPASWYFEVVSTEPAPAPEDPAPLPEDPAPLPEDPAQPEDPAFPEDPMYPEDPTTPDPLPSDDTVAPVVVMPLAGTFGPAGWTGSISGTASDDSGTVAEVAVAIRRTSDSLYYDGTDFTSTTPVLLPAFGTAAWNYAFLPVADGAFTVTAVASDAAGNVSLPVEGSFSYDATEPTSAVTTTGSLTSVTYGGRIQGTASDALAGVASVSVSIRRESDGLFFDGTTFGADEKWLRAEGAATWSYSFAAANAVTYEVTCRATDKADNEQTAGVSSSFSVTLMEPDSSVTTAGFRNKADLAGVAIKSASGAAISKVELEIKRTADGQYFNGTAFTATQAWVVATGTETWTYAFPAEDGKAYEICSRASDADLQVEQTAGRSTFTYDVSAPSCAFTMGDDQNYAGVISGTASDTASGVKSIEVKVFSPTLGRFWDGSRWTPEEKWVAATGTANWKAHFQPLFGGLYDVEARATDEAGNQQVKASTTTVSIPVGSRGRHSKCGLTGAELLLAVAGIALLRRIRK